MSHGDLLVRELACFVARLFAGGKGEVTIRALCVMLAKPMMRLSSSEVRTDSERGDNHSGDTAEVSANVSDGRPNELGPGQKDVGRSVHRM